MGKSTTGLRRPRQHGQRAFLTRDPNAAKRAWIRDLQASGIHYEIKVLEQLPSAIALNDAEQRWIAVGRDLGWPLLNRTAGGEGGAIGHWTPERRAKNRAAHLGKPKHTLESRARISAQAKARAQTPEGRERLAQMSEAARAVNRGHRRSYGKTPSDEARAKMSHAAKGRYHPWNHTPAGRAHMQRITELARVTNLAKKAGPRNS